MPNESKPPHAQLVALGEAIRDIRIHQGLSASDIASKAGLGARQLRELEHGQLDPDLDLILRVADAMGVRASAFVLRAEGLEGTEQ
jgi:transcriptional regulator with XRE-family HTH domain